jgi:hypothetical protein
MITNLLDFAQGGRAKVVEDRQRLEKMQAQPASGQRQSEMPASGRSLPAQTGLGKAPLPAAIRRLSTLPILYRNQT